MRVLVTGGTGFVGSAVVRILLSQGLDVRCLVRPNSNLSNLQGLKVELVNGDLLDPDSLQGALRDCVQLYHVAALYSTRPEDAALMQRINVEGTCNLLKAAVEMGLRRIVYTSTIGTIGRPAGKKLPTESDIYEDWSRVSPYARSKLEAERIALDLAAQGASIVVVNPCAPVGARDIKPSSTGQRILEYFRGLIPYFLPGGINFVSVEDVAVGHLLAAERGRVGERYILGHGEGNLSLEDFYALMEQASGLPRPQAGRLTPGLLRRGMHRLRRGLRRDTLRDLRPPALTADPSRAIRELGLPQTPLIEAFRQAVTWFREHGYA